MTNEFSKLPLLGAKETEQALEKEACRFESSRRPFSLLLIRSRDEQACDTERIAEFLRKRLRGTDTLGQMRDGSLIALLPYTPFAGGEQLANEVVAFSFDQEAPPYCQVLEYPAQKEEIAQVFSGHPLGGPVEGS